jgi:phosphohistidine phosphatase
MKKLFLVRHAKAEESALGQKDFDRMLDQKGLTDAPRMGRTIAENAERPQRLIASPAARAYQTAYFFAEQLKFDTSEIQVEEEIYEASARSLLKFVNDLDDQFDCIMLFGHNPSFSYLTEYLTKEYIGDIPTCGVAFIHFELDTWKAVSENTGMLKATWFPKEI